MSKTIRSSLLASIVPSLMVASSLALIGTQDAAAQAAKPARWSDRATWPDRKVPVAGAKVEIPAGKEVILDVSTPALSGLTINGKLSFADNADVELTTEWVVLHGELAIGSEARPHTRKATITFTDNVKGEDVMGGMGDRGIMIMGGTLNLHGNRTHTWSKLSKTAEAGATSIEVLDASGWQVGDEIVLASTDYDPRQAERRSIAAVSGNRITLDKPLEYMHFGKITFDVDERGEVGLLTRNIRLQASADAEQSYFGGHVMAMPSSRMFVSGVEFNRMGQHLTLARYPIHWHLVGDAKGQYIRNASIHDTYNRCVTVHGTHNLRVENNVTYNTVGHCFFLEDGIETGNQYVRNLGIQTKCHPTRPCDPTNLGAGRLPGAGYDGQSSKDVLIPSDNTVATFWITNPSNDYIGNVAAGSDSTGFWISLPEHPTGQFDGTDVSKATWPRRMPLGKFQGNVGHSNFDAFMFDRNAGPDGRFGVTGSSHIARENPADATSKSLVAVIEDFTAYKNRNGGVWSRGEMKLFRNLKLADNAIGYTHASGSVGRDPFTSRLVDSLFVGETENIGNPRTPAEKAYGRSLPYPELPDFPIRGYEYYDFLHSVENVTFVNYQDNATRKTGAISYLLFTSFGVSSNNAVEKAKFVNAKPVYFPPMEQKWGNDNGASTAYKTAVFKDRDGSVGGYPSYVLIHDGVNDSVAVDEEACEIKRDWNAAVCRGDVGRLNFAARGPAPGARGAGAGGPGAGAPAGAGGPLGGPALGSTPGVVPPGAPRPAAPPPQPPVVLSRNGRQYTVNAGTNVRAGTEIRLTTERPELNLSLAELDQGSWVIFELPGFRTAAAGAQQGSLDALRKATTTSYYRSKDSLWVKVISDGDHGPVRGTTLQVSR